MEFSLNGFANRIDKGYDIDVRAPAPESDNGGESGEVPPEIAMQHEYQRKIRELAPELRINHPRGASILELPETPSSEKEGEQTSKG